MDTMDVAKLLAAANGPDRGTQTNEWFNRVDAAYHVRLENFSHITNREQQPKMLFEFTILGNGGTPGANVCGADTKVMTDFKAWSVDRAFGYIDAIIGECGDAGRLADMDEETRVAILHDALKPSESHHGKSALSGREAYLFTKETNTDSRRSDGKPEFQLVTMKSISDDPELLHRLNVTPSSSEKVPF